MRKIRIFRRPSERGFTILEVVIALSIICFALFAVVSMILHTTTANQTLREQELARESATAKLEEIKARAADPNAFTPATAQYLFDLYNGAAFDVAGLSDPTNAPGLQSGRVVVDNSNPNLFDVKVTIRWKGRQGSRSYTVGSLYTR